MNSRRDPDGGVALAALATVNEVLSRGPGLREDERYQAALAELCAAVTSVVPGVWTASITYRFQPDSTPSGERDLAGVRTLVALSAEAEAVDSLQYAAGQGPCVDALLADPPGRVVHVDDLHADHRWPQLADGVRSSAAPVRAVTSCPLRLPANHLGSLNLYFDRVRHGSDERVGPAQLAGQLLNAGLSGLLHRRRSEHLAVALDSNRQIGAAVGILMAQHHFTYEQALGLLVQASQLLHRKLRDVAEEVILTGAVPSGSDD